MPTLGSATCASGPVIELEYPANVLPSVGMCQHLVLVDLDDLQHALDGLQIRPLLVPSSLVP